jgi:hypothetical protein
MPTNQEQLAGFQSLKAALESLPEKRKARGRLYPQWLLLSIICLAKLCGYHHFTTFARFVRNHRQVMDLLGYNGKNLPCDDTFRYAVKQIAPQELESLLGKWASEMSQAKALSEWQAASIDGKELLGSGVKGDRDHLVSLYHQEARAVLGQVKVKHKSNEIPSATGLLETMDLVGLVIVADALLTQKKITTAIETRGGRYVLALKENHKANYADLHEVFRTDFPPTTGTKPSTIL